MKPPDIPKKLTAAKLTDSFLQSDETYSRLTFTGDQIQLQGVEHLVLKKTQFQGVSLDYSVLYAPNLIDLQMSQCSLANANCERLIVRRAEFVGCRLLGMNVTDGHFQDVTFRDCDIQLARFRFSTFSTVVFEECNLQEANFQGADLSGVHFKKCTLNNAEMSQATLQGTDFRTSMIEGVRVGPKEVVGAVVDHFQAAYMASLLGLVIKGEDEE
ncbi:MAG: pentapeptide repeat-containing protein [Chloroflexota bacterium]